MTGMRPHQPTVVMDLQCGASTQLAAQLAGRGKLTPILTTMFFFIPGLLFL